MYNVVTDNLKEYDLDTEYCLNIYKYFVCESRDMSDGIFASQGLRSALLMSRADRNPWLAKIV